MPKRTLTERVGEMKSLPTKEIWIVKTRMLKPKGDKSVLSVLGMKWC